MNKESSHLKTIMSYNKIGLKGDHTILNTKTKGTMIGTSRIKGNKGEAIANEGSHEKPEKNQRSHEIGMIDINRDRGEISLE